MSLLANSAVIGGEIDVGDIGHSLRFRKAGSTYASKTFSSAGNRQKWTWSGLVKRGTLGTLQSILSVGDGTPADGYGNLAFTATDTIIFSGTPNNSVIDVDVSTTSVFRDPSSHYHIVLAVDTTQATAADRVKLWVTGVAQTLTQTTSPALNATLQFNRGGLYYHSLGMRISFADSYLDGYLSRVCFVDGQALTPSSFGYFNSEINEWVTKTEVEVKAVVDAGGANSFMLEFKNATSLTTLGYDNSSKGNNWTCNGFSLTAGNTYDHMLDVPGNSYATLNPLTTINTAYAFAQDGNLKANCGTGGTSALKATIPIVGKCWAVARVTTVGNGLSIGITSAGVNSYGITYVFNGTKTVYGSNTAYGASYTSGDVIATQVNKTAGTIEFFKQTGGTGSFVSQGVITDSRITTDEHYFVNYNGTSSGSSLTSWNFGQQPEATFVPSTGFLPLCQANLSDSGTVIVSGSFTGNAAADGPCIWMNGVPKTLTINSNAVTFGTHADKLATGFKIRTASTSYNSTGTNTWAATIDSNLQNIFKYNNGEANP